MFIKGRQLVFFFLFKYAHIVMVHCLHMFYNYRLAKIFCIGFRCICLYVLTCLNYNFCITATMSPEKDHLIINIL